MPSILSAVKNSFYNSDFVDAVNMSVELLENKNISRDKRRGIYVLAFLIHFLGKRSSFWSNSNWHCFSLKVKSFSYRSNW